MALASGTRLGPYEIVSPIGAGGMGEVYRAKDTKLNREVAIKVLPESFALDADRVARFMREAQVLASLNHPNIAAIYGIEEQGSTRALVMELVEGEDLSEIIGTAVDLAPSGSEARQAVGVPASAKATAGPPKRAETRAKAGGPHSQPRTVGIPLADALALARQIADALEAAHEQGIIHRDLKPANIKVRADGTVKVLDFGLAKAAVGTQDGGPRTQDLANSPTMTSPAMTEMGMILGTAAYMAPEQARGKTVDKRADIWAFGVVVFEMLTGARAFSGEDITDTIVSVVSKEPDWSALPAATPAGLRRLLARCLKKDPKARLRDIGEARVLLENPASSLVSDATPEAPASGALSRDVPSWRRALPWVAASVSTMALAAALLAWAPWRTRPVPVETRLDIATPPTDDPQSFAISPDGRQIVYRASGEAGSRLWLRRLDSTVAEPLSDTEGARSPFWSPDSRSIAFETGGNLVRLDLGGGRPQTLTSVAVALRGGAWNEDGVILFGDQGALRRVAAAGGNAADATKLADGQEIQGFPAFLPGGRQFLFRARTSREPQGVYLGSLDAPDVRLLLTVDATSGARFLPPSWLAWIENNTLRAQRLDLRNAQVVGDPLTIADPASGLSVSDSGLLAYRTPVQRRTRLAWFDRAGKALGMLSASSIRVAQPRVSPDGRRVVGLGRDVWLLDEARASRLTFNPGAYGQPLWSPDASRIVYASNRKGAVRDLFIKPSGGSGAEELLLESAQDKNPNDWSRDGRFLLFASYDPETGGDLWVLPMTGAAAGPKGHGAEGSAGGRAPWVFLKTKFGERWARFSPDGRFVAYMSNESGRGEIYVRPFIEGGGGANSGQWQVSTAGGISPVWRADGAELFYLAPDGTLMAAPIRVHGTELAPGAPVPLFRPRIVMGGADVGIGPQYDVSKDGRFLITAVDDDDAQAPITLIQNWNPEQKK